jgi:ABC-2 type transport system ATP-binding protein
MLELGSGFHAELTGAENVYLNGSILGMSRKTIARKFDEIVEFSGVGEFIGQPVKNYSSGMYVRLGFSVAISVEPDILVVDEVLAVGDAAFKEKSAAKFLELKERGTTIILVSHSMAMIQRMCDTVALMEQGRIVTIGDPKATIKAYRDSIDAGG